MHAKSIPLLRHNFIITNFLLQDLLKDFLEKKEKGELMIQKTSNLLTTILKEVSTVGDPMPVASMHAFAPCPEALGPSVGAMVPALSSL